MSFCLEPPRIDLRLAAANALGVNLRDAVLSLAKSPQVPGRLEIVPAKRQFQVYVDYAHTPDALLNASVA